MIIYPHISLDLETLSLENDAIITEIGIVFFNEKEIGDSYEILVDWTTQKRSIDPQTVFWVLKQEALVNNLKRENNRKALLTVLFELSRRISKDHYIWANSPSFDCAILKNAFVSHQMDIPWNFRNERDLRTIMHGHSWDEFSDIDRTNKHTALGDALIQAQVIQRLLAQ